MSLRKMGWIAVIIAALAMLGASFAETSAPTGKVLTLRVEGGIGPASAEFIATGIERAARQRAQLVVIEMDTPGGLDTSMRLIIKDILRSQVPVATYVSPEGARAASAGTFILYASHIAAMAPATNVGAAAPVAIGGGGPFSPRDRAEDDATESGSENGEQASDEGEQGPTRGSGRPSGDTMMDKVTNDAAAYIRGLAQLRERDPDFAERAVREAASLSASEALEAGVIEFVAKNIPDLMRQLDGHEVTLDTGESVTLATADAEVEAIEPNWRHQVLAVLSNPQIALVLMMIGIYGLFFEFTSPGFGVPGVAGAICILIAMYAFQLLPVNWAGVALIVLGAVLMLAEAFFPSFGVLGIGGAIAFVVGGLFLIDSELPGFGIPLSFLIAMAVLSALLLFAIGTFAVKARKRSVVSGREEMVGATGTVSGCADGICYAHVHGESWRIRSSQALAPGDQVRITAIDGLTLDVEPVNTITNGPTSIQGGN